MIDSKEDDCRAKRPFLLLLILTLLWLDDAALSRTQSNGPRFERLGSAQALITSYDILENETRKLSQACRGHQVPDLGILQLPPVMARSSQ